MLSWEIFNSLLQLLFIPTSITSKERVIYLIIGKFRSCYCPLKTVNVYIIIQKELIYRIRHVQLYAFMKLCAISMKRMTDRSIA